MLNLEPDYMCALVFKYLLFSSQNHNEYNTSYIMKTKLWCSDRVVTKDREGLPVK